MRIGTLAHSAGVSTKTIRFYERSGLLPEPPRTPSGYRDYPPESAARLDFIRRAQGAGLSLSQIRLVLQARDEGRMTPGTAQMIMDQLRRVEERLADLTRTRDVLRELVVPAQADPEGTGTARSW